MLEDYKNWLDDEVGYLIDPMDSAVNAAILIAIRATTIASLVIGWFVIVTVATPIGLIQMLVRRICR